MTCGGDKICSDPITGALSCGLYGICGVSVAPSAAPAAPSASSAGAAAVASAAATAAAAATAGPTPKPSLKVLGDNPMFLQQYTPYDQCIGGRTQDCDHGCTASVLQTGDSTALVVACPDDSPDPRSPQPYSLVGLRYCRVNTSRTGQYTVTYSVTAGNPVQTVTATRTVVVQKSCAAGETVCDDGQCSAGKWVPQSLTPIP